jgi:hypothetical protein
MLLDPKKMATAIISSKAGKDGGEEKREEKPRSDKSVAKSSAMSSFLSAIDRKDADGMARALGTFHDLHSSRDDEDDGDGAEGMGADGEIGNPRAAELNKKQWS